MQGSAVTKLFIILFKAHHVRKRFLNNAQCKSPSLSSLSNTGRRGVVTEYAEEEKGSEGKGEGEGEGRKESDEKGRSGCRNRRDAQNLSQICPNLSVTMHRIAQHSLTEDLQRLRNLRRDRTPFSEGELHSILHVRHHAISYSPPSISYDLLSVYSSF